MSATHSIAQPTSPLHGTAPDHRDTIPVRYLRLFLKTATNVYFPTPRNP